MLMIVYVQCILQSYLKDSGDGEEENDSDGIVHENKDEETFC